MPLGTNSVLKDKLIKNTVRKESSTINESKEVNKGITNFTSDKPNKHTHNTKKMTFYVKEDLAEKLYNFAYWDRYSVTEAINVALADGLNGKNTDEIKRK